MPDARGSPFPSVPSLGSRRARPAPPTLPASPENCLGTPPIRPAAPPSVTRGRRRGTAPSEAGLRRGGGRTRRPAMRRRARPRRRHRRNRHGGSPATARGRPSLERCSPLRGGIGSDARCGDGSRGPHGLPGRPSSVRLGGDTREASGGPQRPHLSLPNGSPPAAAMRFEPRRCARVGSPRPATPAKRCPVAVLRIGIGFGEPARRSRPPGRPTSRSRASFRDRLRLPGPGRPDASGADGTHRSFPRFQSASATSVERRDDPGRRRSARHSLRSVIVFSSKLCFLIFVFF